MKDGTLLSKHLLLGLTGEEKLSNRKHTEQRVVLLCY